MYAYIYILLYLHSLYIPQLLVYTIYKKLSLPDLGPAPIPGSSMPGHAPCLGADATGTDATWFGIWFCVLFCCSESEVIKTKRTNIQNMHALLSIPLIQRTNNAKSKWFSRAWPVAFSGPSIHRNIRPSRGWKPIEIFIKGLILPRNTLYMPPTHRLGKERVPIPCVFCDYTRLHHHLQQPLPSGAPPLRRTGRLAVPPGGAACTTPAQAWYAGG